jgi:hypothetical protein
MTNDEIIRMAREAGSCSAVCEGCDNVDVLCGNSLERFATLVAEATKEKMKKVFAVATPKSTWTTDRIIAEIEDMK